jgi:hypothetical protein
VLALSTIPIDPALLTETPKPVDTAHVPDMLEETFFDFRRGEMKLCRGYIGKEHGSWTADAEMELIMRTREEKNMGFEMYGADVVRRRC